MQIDPKSRIVTMLPPDWDAAALDALGAFPKSLDFLMSRWYIMRPSPKHS